MLARECTWIKFTAFIVFRIKGFSSSPLSWSWTDFSTYTFTYALMRTCIKTFGPRLVVFHNPRRFHFDIVIGSYKKLKIFCYCSFLRSAEYWMHSAGFRNFWTEKENLKENVKVLNAVISNLYCHRSAIKYKSKSKELCIWLFCAKEIVNNISNPNVTSFFNATALSLAHSWISCKSNEAVNRNANTDVVFNFEHLF